MQLIACVLRNTGAGWEVLDDVGHEPMGVAGVVQKVDHLELQYASTASQVVAMTVTVDETYAKQGLRTGASAGFSVARIYMYQGADNSPALDPSTVSANNGNLWVLGYLLT